MLISCFICFVESHPNNPNNESGVIAQCIAHLPTSSPLYPLACNSFCHSKAQVQCCKRIWDNVSGSFGPKSWAWRGEFVDRWDDLFQEGSCMFEGHFLAKNMCISYKANWVSKTMTVHVDHKKRSGFSVGKNMILLTKPGYTSEPSIRQNSRLWFHLTEMVTLPETNIAPEKSKIMVGLVSFWDG